jgi:orotidine-5'-phosphate decarboxylase
MKPVERLIFALDVPDIKSAESFVNLLAGSVGLFKVGLELFAATGPSVLELIKKAGADFFLDLKLHDIPKTVERAMAVIANSGASLATVHAAGGPAMLEAAAKGAKGKTRVLAVTVLTSQGEEDARAAGAASVSELVVARAIMAQKAGCHGVICSGLEAAKVKAATGPGFLCVCPGIRLDASQGKDDQVRVVTPENAISQGADYIVIGRPIRDAKDPVAAAREIARRMGG